MAVEAGQLRVVPMARLRRALLRVGLLEWVIMVQLLAFSLRLLAAADAQAARPYLAAVLGLLAAVAGSTALYRACFEGRVIPRLLHRLVVLGGLFGPYFMLKRMIPVIEPAEFDAVLRGIDLWLVGGDAAVWLERFATPFTSAWFAASYYGYYVVGGGFVLGMLLFCRRQDVLIEFGLLLCTAACIADLTYTLVPARGPYHHLAHLFAGPLPEDRLVPFVHGVIQNGPLLDVFPSMHTCLPLCIFLFSARHLPPAALITGLWLPHIVLSTMFLRYHYLIDVIAGALLALVLFAAVRPAMAAYERWRQRTGVAAEP